MSRFHILLSSSRQRRRWPALVLLTTPSCYPFVHHGTPASVRLIAESSRSTQDTLHLALTVQNRMREEIMVRVWANGPLVDIRDGAGRERCVTRGDGPQVYARGEVAVYLRVASGAAVTLRRDLVLHDLTNCGPGRVTLSAQTEVIPMGAPRPQTTLSQRRSLTIRQASPAG